MGSNKGRDIKDVFTEDTKSGESFNYTKEDSNSVWNEDFVYKFEENKITFTNELGKSGQEENDNSSSLKKGAEKDRDDDNEDLEEQAESSSSSASSSSSSATSSSSSTASSSSSAAATSTAAASTAGVVQAVATVATTAVVFVVGGGIVLTSVQMPTPEIIQFDYLEASIDSIFYSVLIGNNEETIRSGEENDECYICVELRCESYNNIYRMNEVRNFGVHEGTFEDLVPDTEYTVNIYKSDFAGLQTEYLIEPVTVRTLPDGKPTSITLNAESATLCIGDTFQAYVESTIPEGANKQVYWESGNSEIATVDDNGLITGISEGITHISATSILVPGIIANIEIKVIKKAPTAIGLNQSEVSLNVNDEFQFEVASVEPEGADDSVSWAVDAEDECAIIDEFGKLTAKKEGTARVTATSTRDESVVAYADVTINKAIPTKITLNSKSQEIVVGGTFKIVHTVEPSYADNSVTYKSDDPEVASVSTDGVVTGVSVGRTSIIVASVRTNTVYAILEIFVFEETVEEIAPTSIGLNIERVNVIVGQTYELSVATCEPTEANRNVTWSSDDETIATVDENGVVTAIEIGHAYITATSVMDPDVSAECLVFCRGEVAESITLNSEVESLDIDDTFQIVATVLPEGAEDDLIYESSDTDIAVVSPSGVVYAVAPGEATITVSSNDDRVTDCSATMTIIVRPTIEDIAVVNDEGLPAEVVEISGVGETYQCVVQVYPEGANSDVIYTSENEGIAAVDETGLIRGVANGDTTVTVTSVKNSNINFTISVHVGPYPPVYTMHFSILQNAMGDEKYLISFEVENESWEFLYYYVCLMEYRGEGDDRQEYTIATATIEGDITNTNTLIFDGSFNNEGTYNLVLIGYLELDGEPTTTRLYEEEIDFSSIQRQEGHNNQVFITQVTYKDTSSSTILSTYRVYVDSESAEYSQFKYVEFYPQGDTTNRIGYLSEGFYREQITTPSLFNTADLPDTIVAVVYDSVPVEGDSAQAVKSYEYPFSPADIRVENESVLTEEPTLTFYRSEMTARSIHVNLDYDEYLFAGATFSMTAYAFGNNDPVFADVSLNQISDNEFSVGDNNPDYYNAIFGNSSVEIIISMNYNNTTYTIWDVGGQDYSSATEIGFENCFSLIREEAMGSQGYTYNYYIKVLISTAAQEKCDSFFVTFSCGDQVATINLTNIDGTEQLMEDDNVKAILSINNNDDITVKVCGNLKDLGSSETLYEEIIRSADLTGRSGI